MGISKDSLFNKEQNDLAAIFRVLAHPARIAIIQYLIVQNTCITKELVDEIGLAQATVSQHLKELKTIGLISGIIDENKPCYCLNRENWLKHSAQIEAFFNVNLKPINNCC